MYRTTSSRWTVISSLWNVLVCSLILYWRWRNSNDTNDALITPNLFGLQLCLMVFLTNVCYCCLLNRLGPHTENWLTQLAKISLCLPPMFHCAAVLFGAPFLKNWDQTMAFSLLMSGLVLPSVVAGSGQTSSNTTDVTHFIKSQWFKWIPLSTLTGAWLAAVVIPLDWDRPWQIWPEPSCVGAVAATCLASLHHIVTHKRFIKEWRH